MPNLSEMEGEKAICNKVFHLIWWVFLHFRLTFRQNCFHKYMYSWNIENQIQLHTKWSPDLLIFRSTRNYFGQYCTFQAGMNKERNTSLYSPQNCWIPTWSISCWNACMLQWRHQSYLCLPETITKQIKIYHHFFLMIAIHFFLRKFREFGSTSRQ